MPRELKKYGLRSTRKPAKNPLLSTVVRVHDEHGKDGYCYVSFDASLTEAVGKKLTRGIAPYDPAYLVAEYDAIRAVWVIGARYLNTDEGTILWTQVEKPAWLKEVYHGNNRSQASGKTSRGSGDESSTGKEKGSAPHPLSHADDYSLAA